MTVSWTQSLKDNSTNQHNRFSKKEGRNGNKRSCATSVASDEKWKEELLKKVQDLKLNQQTHHLTKKLSDCVISNS